MKNPKGLLGAAEHAITVTTFAGRTFGDQHLQGSYSEQGP